MSELRILVRDDGAEFPWAPELAKRPDMTEKTRTAVVPGTGGDGDKGADDGKPVPPEPTEENTLRGLESMTRDELKEKAKAMGLSLPANVATTRLIEAIRDAEEAMDSAPAVTLADDEADGAAAQAAQE